MSNRKPGPPSSTSATRTRVLAAARRLLGSGDAAFSMRELAAAAGVSFATPFNQFGNKAAIMQALSAELVERMSAEFAEAPVDGSTAARVLTAVDVAVAVMLRAPAVNRAVMGALGAPAEAPGGASDRSRALWATAVGDGESLDPREAGLARTVLPDQLAVAFRGVLSFWSAGEIDDAGLTPRARQAAATVLLGFVQAEERRGLTRLLRGEGRSP